MDVHRSPLVGQLKVDLLLTEYFFIMNIFCIPFAEEVIVVVNMYFYWVACLCSNISAWERNEGMGAPACIMLSTSCSLVWRHL